MIKKTQNSTRQQLLRKNSIQSVQISEVPPFEIQECYSTVGYDQRQFSYYCLENQQATGKALVNPYTIQMSDRSYKCDNGNKLQCNNTKETKHISQKITMNGNCYVKASTEEQKMVQKKIIEEIKAFCSYCRTFQLIPKGSTKFICYSCRVICKCVSQKSLKPSQEMSETMENKNSIPTPTPKQAPNMKIFKCGNCFVKVQYEQGVSQYIRCSKCHTVNMVPN